MAKSTRDLKITDDQINDIGTEVSHIRNLVQLLIPLGEDDQLDSGLVLIDRQAEKIQSMLEDVFHG